MNATSAWLDEHWGNLRTSADGALKQIGQLPSAVMCTENDPGDAFIHNVVAKLSDWLCCLDTSVGERPPAVADEADREWLGKHWQNLRECVDAALVALGSMPVAINAINDDNADHVQELIVLLSDALTVISGCVGKHQPGADPLHRESAEAAE